MHWIESWMAHKVPIVFLFVYVSILTFGTALLITANDSEKMHRRVTTTTVSYQSAEKQSRYYLGAEVYYALLGNDEDITVLINHMPVTDAERFEPEQLMKKITLNGTYSIDYTFDGNGNVLSADYVKVY